MNADQQLTPTPLEQPVATATSRRHLSIGLPRSASPSELRFPLTPEVAALLIEDGYNIVIEEGAAGSIHYTDAQYTRIGATIGTRQQAFATDIVVYLPQPSSIDISCMRRGALLLTLFNPSTIDSRVASRLLSQGVTTIALNLIADHRGNLPFADILDEISGRAAIARAAALLADAVHGKGILLGGIAGIVPCEITIIGSDIAAQAAARSALGAGAQVRMFDNDVYRLREATRSLGDAVVGSTLHPKVLSAALRAADVIVFTDATPATAISADLVSEMKSGVVIFDLSSQPGKAFPSLPTIDLSQSQPVDINPEHTSRACYVNAGNTVPRTAAMALSNAMLPLLRDIDAAEGLNNALKICRGLKEAALTFAGKAVNPDIAEAAGTRHVDINIFLTLS